MALVEYSSSDSDSQAPRRPLKRKRPSPQPDRKAPPSALPPLPSTFHDLYASAARASTHDDPALHRGRKRAVPHVEGNWPTHVYLEWRPTITETSKLNAVVSSFDGTTDATSSPSPGINSLVVSDIGTPLPLHISLSASLSVATDQKESFHAAIVEAVGRSGVLPFKVALKGSDWVSNAEETRWFLVLRVQRPAGNELNKLLDACNRAAKQFELPTLYYSSTGKGGLDSRDGGLEPQRRANPKWKSGRGAPDERDQSHAFHFSIGWTLEKPARLKDKDASSPEPGCALDVEDIHIDCDAVKVKIGNTIHHVGLQRKHTISPGSILG